MSRMTRTFALLSLALLLTAPALAAGTKAGKPAKGKEAARRLVDEGAALLRLRKYAPAIAAFQGATRLDSGSAEAYFRLGDAYYQRAFRRGTAEPADTEDANLALAAYQTASALDPTLRSVSDPYLLHHGAAMCHRALHRYDEALAELRKAMAESPGNPMPSLYAAQIRLLMKDIPLSSTNLQLGIQRARRLRSYRQLARLVRADPSFSGLLAVGQNQAILKAYEEVEEGTLSESRVQERIQELSTYRDSPRNADSHVSPQARIEAPRAAESGPVVMESLGRGHVEFRRRRYRAAVQEYRHALDEDAGRRSLGPAHKALLLENMGTAYRMLGDADGAARALEEAVRLAPQAGSAYYQLALACSVSGRFSRALESLDFSLKKARSMEELRRLLLQAKTDPELDPVRDLPTYRRILRLAEARLSVRR